MIAHADLAAALDRLAYLEADDPAVVISRVPDRILEQSVAEVHDAAEPPAVLRGVTFVVKDNIDVEGSVSTAACPSFGNAAERSAAVVRRLMDAGAVPVAKVNMDQFATGLVGTRSPYGTPRNPFDPTLVPGGSSSGSAVAVARGVVPFALGTDTAGSGRVPAALCGIVGLKPTRGWLSTQGVLPAVRSIDCVSVFAATIELAWQATLAAAGDDSDDPFSRRAPVAAGALARSVGTISSSTLEALGTDPTIIDGYGAAIASLAAAGIRIVEIDPQPLFEIGDLLYGGPWVAERWSAVGGFVAGEHEGLDPVVRAIITGASNWSAGDVHAASERLATLRRRVDGLFAEIDAVLTPTVPFLPTVEEVASDPRGVNDRLGRFTTFTNLADLCALAFPVGVAPTGRPPVSVTLHAPAWSDALLVNTAGLLTGRTPQVPDGWIRLAVAGAHLRGLPLEWQLTDRRAMWLGTTRTAPGYRLVALPDTVPPKPGLHRTGGETTIEVDVWALAPAAFGEFVAAIPAPLCIGTVDLADGTSTPGFLCEPRALEGATDVTSFGGWRGYLASR